MSDYTEGDFQEIEPGSEGDPFAELPRLGQLLRHYRRRAGLSQRQLSLESKVTQGNLSLIEQGSTESPHDKTLDALAAALTRYLPLDADQIFARLIEARNQPPTEYGIDPEATMLSDRLAVYTPKDRRTIYDLLNRVIDTYDKLTGAR